MLLRQAEPLHKIGVAEIGTDRIEGGVTEREKQLNVFAGMGSMRAITVIASLRVLVREFAAGIQDATS